MANPIDAAAYAQYFLEGVDFDTYCDNFKKEDQAGTSQYAEYLKLNLHRLNRINRNLTLSETWKALLNRLPEQHWIVISEHWCGDAAQIVPVIAQLAQHAANVKLSICYRDQNLPLMDAHLTGTSRSIPKLIVLDAQFQLLDSWGPRPAAAQTLVENLKANNTPFEALAEALHDWYAKDHQASTLQELQQLLENTISVPE